MDEAWLTPALCEPPPESVDALLDDQSVRWRRGERAPAEDFLNRLGPRDDADAALDLIYHEIMLRTRRGERPDLEEYARRFPHYAGELRTHFEVHRAVLSGEEAATTPDAAPPGGPPPAVPGYEILGELGRGGLGVVYHARHAGLKRPTALKMLHGGPGAGPRESARLRGEAETLARIGHPHIIQIYEVGEFAGRLYLALEYAPGGSLAARLGGAPQPARAAALLVEALARAVHAAHRAGVVHRDLKPANVLFAADGAPKVADFGLAKRLDGDAAQTRTGDILGTPSYMAPEQARGRNAEVGPWTDVYALGAILYELLTGRPPFKGETVWDTLEQAVGREPAPVRQLTPKAPRDLETICLKCLRKDPARRYRGADQLADDLARFLAGRPVHARPTPAWERAWKWVRRRPGMAAAAAAAVVLTAAMAAAHEIDLRGRLADARRTAATADAGRLLEGVREEVNAGHWEEAGERLRDGAATRLASARASFTCDARLKELSDEAERLRGQIDARLTDAARLGRFRELRRDAAFDATPVSGRGAADRLLRTRAAAAEALALFGLTPDAGEAPAEDGPCYSDAEMAEVREGCCELLLELADAETAASAGGAGRAAALLDRAARLGVETPLIAERRRGGPPPERAGGLTRAFEWFLRANDLAAAGRLPGAIDAYEKALAFQPDHFGARYALAVCYLKDQADGEEFRKAHLLLAREHLTRCVAQLPDRVWPYLHRATACGELGDAAAADADFDQAERLLRAAPDPTALYALYVNRGVAHIRRGDPEGAAADLKRAADLEPGELPAYLDLAKAYQDERLLPEARKQLDRAAALAAPATLAVVYRGRAKVDQEQNDLAAAVRDLEQAVRAEPAGPTSPAAAADLRLMARLLLQDGKPTDALRAADAALAAAPGDHTPERIRAEALLRLDRFAEAVRALDAYAEGERAAGRRPEPAVYRARARASAALDDRAAAAEDYTRALDGERGPDAAADHVGRGWCYIVLEAPALARRDFDEAIRLDPDDGDAYNGRGYALAGVGRPREAVRDAEEALRRGPHDARALYNAARVYALSADLQGAGAVQADPRDRAELLARQDRALDLLRAAMESLADGRRADFWRRNVENDAAMNFLRPAAGFRKLAAAYGGSS